MQRNERDLVLPEPPGSPAAATCQEQAYRRLRHSIMVGALQPGRPLTIRGIAEALAMSATPVREALRRLASEGAVSVLENRRVVIPAMTAERFEALVQLRCVLECHAAERALPFLTERRIDEIEGVDHALDDALAANDLSAAVVLNQRFHAGIYAADPHGLVLPMIESLWLQLGPFFRIAVAYVGEHYPVDRHREALAAMRNRDAAALNAAIAADIRDGVGDLGREALAKILGNRKSRSAA